MTLKGQEGDDAAPTPHRPGSPCNAAYGPAAFRKGHRSLRRADEWDTHLTEAPCTPLAPLRATRSCSLAPGAGDKPRHVPQAERTAQQRTPGVAASTGHTSCAWRGQRGVDAAVLSAFRTRMMPAQRSPVLFDTWLTWCRGRQLVNARGRQRTASTHILAAVRALNRIEVVSETMRHALNSLALVAPEWLRTVSPSEWQDRDARRAEDDRLPTKQAARAALALAIGPDGWRLLVAIDDATAPSWLRECPPSASYAECGSKTIAGTARSCSGAKRTTAHRRRSAAARLTIRKPTTRASTPHHGWATRCISRKPAKMTSRTSSPTSKRRVGPAADGAATPKMHEAWSSGVSCPEPLSSIPVF